MLENFHNKMLGEKKAIRILKKKKNKVGKGDRECWTGLHCSWNTIQKWQPGSPCSQPLSEQSTLLHFTSARKWIHCLFIGYILKHVVFAQPCARQRIKSDVVPRPYGVCHLLRL